MANAIYLKLELADGVAYDYFAYKFMKEKVQPLVDGQNLISYEWDTEPFGEGN